MANDNTDAPAPATLTAMPVGGDPIQPPPKPERLILWFAPGLECAPIRNALAARFKLTVPGRLDEIDPTPGESAPILLLFASAETRVLAGLEQDSESEGLPARAVAAWCDEAEAMLRLNRANRRRVHLLDVAMAGRNPRAFLSHFALPETKDMIAALETLDRAPGDPVLTLLARHCLGGTSRAATLRDELAAVAYDFAPVAAGGRAAREEADAVLSAYRKAQQSSEQNTLLHSQNALIQGELDSQVAACTALEQQAARLGDEARKARSQATELERANSSLRDDLARLGEAETRLGQRLEQTSQGLESSQRELAGMKQQTELLKAQNRLLQDETEILQKNNQSLSSQAEEGARMAIRIAAKEQALSAAATRLDTLENRITLLNGTAERQRAEADGRITALETDLHESRERSAALERELQRITMSKSFRLTAPLRRLRGLLSGQGQR